MKKIGGGTCCIGEVRSSYKVLFGISERKKSLGRL
jgi:hypothetical protein